MSRFIRTILIVILLIAGVASQHAEATQQTVRHLIIASAINPVTATFISRQISIANQNSEPAILIQLDTPGGLDTSMREIIQAELSSTIPVIIYIAPQGARAASAGALITLAADFAVMAPGTNIGAAHPVAIGAGKQTDSTMMKKVENDAAAYARSLAQKRGRNQDWAERSVRDSVSISAEEALDLTVIDLIADGTDHLLNQLHNYKYIRNGKTLTFTTQGIVLQQIEMDWREKILNTLSNPNIAYLLLMLGIIGIFFEISQPGVVLPGAIGTIAILLALFAFSSLPINYVGFLLIILAIVLFILEVKVVSYGMLAVGGIISMALGSIMLIDSSEPYLQISRAVIAATVTVSAGFFLLATGMVVKTQRRPVISGQEGMVGEIGEAIDPISDSGMVFVHGEYWQACSDQPIPVGAKIRIIKVMDGLKLQVETIEPKEV
ncbi:MAG: nodulation protein NfeD [Desulfuromusa sp.]|jgi:membrane-bound serine protease (ClpP class)|nr:nodulation protein NfeD [Desulfuromusa sp.]